MAAFRTVVYAKASDNATDAAEGHVDGGDSFPKQEEPILVHCSRMNWTKIGALANIGCLVVGLVTLVILFKTSGASVPIWKYIPVFVLSACVVFGAWFNWKANRLVRSVQPNQAPPTKKEENSDGSLSAKGRFYSFAIPVGDFKEFDGIRIEVRELRDNVNPEAGELNDGAVLYIDSGGGLVYGGNRTTEIETNCYYLPITRFKQKEPYSLYFHHFSKTYVHFLSIYLEHINPHSAMVTIKACKMQTTIFS